MEQQAPEPNQESIVVARTFLYKPTDRIISELLTDPNGETEKRYPPRGQSASAEAAKYVRITDKDSSGQHREIPPEDDTQLTTDMFEQD